MKIQVINGPNLNMLGIREPEIYGTLTLQQIEEQVKAKAEELGITLSFYQSNHEGNIVDQIQSCYGQADGIIINPAAHTHYSIAVRDAISAVGIPTVEVHLSKIQEREEFRRTSVVRDVCLAQIAGKGVLSYTEALEFLHHHLTSK